MNNGNYNIRRKTDNNVNSNYNGNDENYEMTSNEGAGNINADMNMRRNSDNNAGININDNTLINLDKGQPVGLDFKKFMSEANPDMTVHSISQSNDLPIISEVTIQLTLGKRRAPEF